MSAFTREVAIVSYAEDRVPEDRRRNEVEILMPLISSVLDAAGLEQQDVGFTVSGSSDYLQGAPFAFVAALDAVGAWPPIRESHLEMDAAFALFEACCVLQHGDIDTALVYGFGRPSRGDLDQVLALQLDPYLLTPLWPDATHLAQLQAQALRDSGRFADVPDAGPTPVEDGGAALLLATGDRARELAERAGTRPVWIRAIDHRIEPPALGARDLTVSVSTRLAAAGAGVAPGQVDFAALHVQYPPQELVLREALGLADGAQVDADFGPFMAGGLMRFGRVFRELQAAGGRGVAHATSGACLQQNLVGVLEGVS